MLRRSGLLLLLLYLVGATAWIVASGFSRNQQLLNVACDPTRELWTRINAAFIEEYEAQYGERLVILQSHNGSASQARTVIEGQQADVVTLALWPDTDAIRQVGLIADGWEERLPNRSLPYTSTIVFVVRKGNPKQIHDWVDLDNPAVQIITPSPKTSGNGKWSFLAMWGSYLRHTQNDVAATEAFVSRVYRRTLAESAARDSTMTFSKKKIGDVHLTWENEAHLEIKEANGELEIVYPKWSIIAEPHVAMVDDVVRRKGTQAKAEAYLKFLYTDAAQEIIAEQYHRPTNPAVLARHRHRFPEIPLFAARELGSWSELNARFFAEGALYDRISEGRK